MLTYDVTISKQQDWNYRKEYKVTRTKRGFREQYYSEKRFLRILAVIKDIPEAEELIEEEYPVEIAYDNARHVEKFHPVPHTHLSDGYWMNLRGELFDVGFCGHSQASRELLFKYHRNAWEGDRSYVDTLESFGWIHISGSHVYSEKKPNDKQYEALMLLASVVTYPNMAESLKRFAFKW